MDGMNGTERAELQAEQQAERDARDAARMRHEARRHTYAVLYLGRAWRVEANLDAEYGAEWALNEASLLADENVTLTAQLVDYEVTKERLARERILRDDAHRQISAQKAQLVQAESNLNATQKMLDATIAERDELRRELDAVTAERDSAQLEILTAQVDVYTEEAKTGEAHDTVCQLEAENAALMTERDTLAAKLDAAHARLAERENAALVADATDVCAGFSAAALYRMYTLEKGISEERRRAVERLTARLNGAQIAADIGLDDAHEDDDDATPVTLGDRKQQEARSIEWTPPTRSKPDAAA